MGHRGSEHRVVVGVGDGVERRRELADQLGNELPIGGLVDELVVLLPLHPDGTRPPLPEDLGQVMADHHEVQGLEQGLVDGRRIRVAGDLPCG